MRPSALLVQPGAPSLSPEERKGSAQQGQGSGEMLQVEREAGAGSVLGMEKLIPADRVSLPRVMPDLQTHS